MSNLVNAVQENNIAQIEKILSAPYSPLQRYDEAFCLAVKNQNKTVTDLILNFIVNPNYCGGMPLYLACHNGWLDIVVHLLESGSSPNPPSGLPLTNASKQGHVEIVKLLLYNGANPNAVDGQALILAATNNNAEIVKLLMERGANPNPVNTCLLSIVKENNYDEIAELLESNSAEIYEVDYGNVG